MKKISRNDPCPCNSGRKYKHCCQKREETRPASTRSGLSSAPSIAERLQLGIQYHQAGNLPQAEAIYRQILQVAPDHPGALHFLGLIARQAGKIELAVELISKALAFKPDYAEAHGNLGNALKQQGRLDDAIASYRSALKFKPDMAEVYGNLGNALGEQGKLDEAIASYRKALTFKPDFAGVHSNLGNALREQGKLDKAITSYRMALKIKPDFGEAHSNLGNALIERGKPEEAVASFQKALVFRPDFAEAHNNLGNALRELGRLDEAIASYRKALACKADYAQAYSNLGNVLREQGELHEAVINYRSALRISDSREIKNGFVQCIRKIYFTHETPGIRPLVIRAMSEPWGRPADLGNAAVSLVKLNPDIRKCMDRAASAWPARLSQHELLGPPGSHELAAVCDDPLLRCLLENTPVCDVELEQFLTAARYVILEAALREEKESAAEAAFAALSSDAVGKRMLIFGCALARQCFINEYVFAHSEEEFAQAQSLRDRLAAALASSLPVPPLWLAAAGAYFPLISLPSAETLVKPLPVRSWPDAVVELLVQQVQERLEERQYRSLIPRLTSIADPTSRLVQKQYEENPYPRWAKLPPGGEVMSINSYLRDRFPFSRFAPMGQGNGMDSRTDILIAGCGTGQHSITTAQRYRNAEVLAVDLSLTSLCYAARMTRNLGLENIRYAQADIMELGSPGSITPAGRMFDIVESVGVLHHLADPLAGWRRLLSLLRPGGFMRLGFYSEYARRNEAAAQRFMAESGYTPAPDDIRRCRQQMMSAENFMQFRQVLSARDFYTMSECRDLLFHVQEHRYTLPQLKENLRELELSLIGFSLDPDVVKQYGKQFPDDISHTDLDNWHIFETRNPDIFNSMYQFWVQKAG